MYSLSALAFDALAAVYCIGWFYFLGSIISVLLPNSLSQGLRVAAVVGISIVLWGVFLETVSASTRTWTENQRIIFFVSLLGILYCAHRILKSHRANLSPDGTTEPIATVPTPFNPRVPSETAGLGVDNFHSIIQRIALKVAFPFLRVKCQETNSLPKEIAFDDYILGFNWGVLTKEAHHHRLDAFDLDSATKWNILTQIFSKAYGLAESAITFRIKGALSRKSPDFNQGSADGTKYWTDLSNSDERILETSLSKLGKRISSIETSIQLQKEQYKHCEVECSKWDGKHGTESRYDFARLEDLVDTSHEHYRLLQCNRCGASYLWHWHEEIGWDGEGDRQTIVLRKVSPPDLAALNFWIVNNTPEANFEHFLDSLAMGR